MPAQRVVDPSLAAAIALGMGCLMLGMKVVEYKGIASKAGSACADSGAQAYDLHALAVGSPLEVQQEVAQIFSTHTAGVLQRAAPTDMANKLRAQMDAKPTVKVRAARMDLVLARACTTHSRPVLTHVADVYYSFVCFFEA